MVTSAITTPAPSIAVLLLNYQAADLTLKALQSLEALDYPSFEVHVIDNASGDDSAERLRAYCDSGKAVLHENTANLGYSGGYNVVIQKLLQESPHSIAAFWLLNNDTTVEPNALTALVSVWQQQPLSLVGSCIRYPDGRFQRAASQWNRLKTGLQDIAEDGLKEGAYVDALTGASWLLPRGVFDDVGLLDERYFLYFEDNDYCFQARQAGWSCRVAMSSVVYHEESATTKRQPELMAYYYQRNRLLFLQRFLSPLLFRWAMAYTAFRFWRAQRKAKKAGGSENHIKAFSTALADFKAGVQGKCLHDLGQQSSGH